MKHFIYLSALLLLMAFQAPMPPNQYPQGFFQSPVGHQIELSGTFGELRPNHFHSGIDVRPGRGLHNEPIFACAEGYVSRINILGGGYGQAIYIAHPNGFTTVYAHLDKLSPELTAFLRKKQYESEDFDQDLTLQPTDLPVFRGQQIGVMGNRGHSFGEHLHFEIRETATDNPINPLLFGFFVSDQKPPSVSALKAYFLNDKKEVIGEKIFSLQRRADGTFGITGDTLNVPAPNVAFALKTYDTHDGASGDNGIYSLELKNNGTSVYQFKAEKFPFNETRYLNAHLDYQEQTVRRSYFHRLFVLIGNHLSMYQSVDNQGIVAIGASEVRQITATSGDVVGNTAFVNFYVRQIESLPPPAPKAYTYFLPVNEASIVQPDGAHFFFPKNCFYDNIYLNFGSNTEGGSYGVYSSSYHFQNYNTPIHTPFTIKIKPYNLPDSLRTKAFVAYCTRESGRVHNAGGKWSDDGFIQSKNNRFGTYCIMTDITPPTIRPLSFQYNMKKAKRISFKINDNYETMGTAAGLTYRAEVDGQWLLMELDGKRDVIYYDFEEGKIDVGEHIFHLSLKDGLDNESVFEAKFVR